MAGTYLAIPAKGPPPAPLPPLVPPMAPEAWAATEAMAAAAFSAARDEVRAELSDLDLVKGRRGVAAARSDHIRDQDPTLERFCI